MSNINPYEDAFAVPSLEFAFQIDVELGQRRKLGDMGYGYSRGYGPIIGGTIKGPLLNGIVVGGSGCDFPMYRPDGVFQFDARYMLEADDGTPIILHNKGYRYAAPEIMARIDSGEQVDPSLYYHRFAPTFEVPVGPHDWLGRTIFIGVGKRGSSISRFRYYKVL